MSQSPENPRAIVKASDNSLMKERKILKAEIAALPIWFGQRLLDNSDHRAFEIALELYRRCAIYTTFTVFDANDMKEPNPNVLRPMAEDLKKVLDQAKEPLAVFVITSAWTEKHLWVDQFCKNLQEYRQKENQRDDTFGYKIIMGGYLPESGEEDPNGHFDGDEMTAHKIGGVYLYFKTDAPTAGCARLVEFMNRVMGEDLPGKEFPNYSVDEIRKIAWNLNRENFNTGYVREGSIPKYPIDRNGRPVFVF